MQSLAPAENFPAGAFFDVWAVLVTSALGRLSAAAPSRFAATIGDLPPSGGETFVADGQAVPLLDAFRNEDGAVVFEGFRAGDPGRCPFEDEPHLSIGPDGQTIVESSEGAGPASITISLGASSGPPRRWTGSRSCGRRTACTDSHEPPPSDLLWYLRRDGYGTGQGSWNDPFVAVDR